MAKRGHYTKHPSIYIDDYGAPHLIIFRNFFTEPGLPKLNQQKIKDEELLALIDSNSDTMAKQTNIPSWKRTGDTNPYNYQRAQSDALRSCEESRGILSFLKNKIFRKNSVDKTFELIKKNLAKRAVTKELEEVYTHTEKFIQFLKDSGQITQAERVEAYHKILGYEMILMKHGYDKYLVEKDIIDFMKKTDRGVNITFLRNFTNILPVEVAKKKIEVDNLMVFDNYAILFYDPGVDAFKYIKEDEDRRLAKDPILFGLIEGSDKLYYITDWVYKDDDLTMEKVETILGRKAQLIQDSKISETDWKIADAIETLVNQVEAIRP